MEKKKITVERIVYLRFGELYIFNFWLFLIIVRLVEWYQSDF